MKFMIVILLLLSSGFAHADDSTDHFAAATAVSLADHALLVYLAPEMEPDKRHLHALAVCAGAGAGKELIDEYQHRNADPWDFAASLAGCAMGGVIAGGIETGIEQTRGGWMLRLRREF